MTEDTLNAKTPWQDLTIGGNIYQAGNAKEFKTGVQQLLNGNLMYASNVAFVSLFVQMMLFQ